MRAVQAAVTIDAPPSDAPGVLTAADEDESSTPMLTRVTGELSEGARSKLTITPRSRRSTTFRPRVLRAVPDHVLAWKGSAGVPAVCDGQHEFVAVSTLPVRLEQFGGLLVPFLSRRLEPAPRGFTLLHDVLCQRVEAGVDAR